jgi:FkbM family methyltransferase
MASGRPQAASSTVRGIYRRVVPKRIRQAFRATLAPPPPKKTNRRPERRFVLPLPRPEAGVGLAPNARTSLTYEVPSQFYVTRQLEAGGVAGYEAATAAVVLGVAEAIRPDVFFDVGANVGPHALFVDALLGVPVVAFEPAADVADALRHVIALNGLRCTVETLAIGASDGTETLFISPTDTSTSLRAGFRSAKAEISVPVRSLDSFIRERGIRPSLLKIDTETTEPAVLRGASDLLAARPWLVLEVLPGWTEEELEDLLLPLGYLAYQIADPFPMVRHDRLVGHASLEAGNWLFAPVEPGREVWQAIDRWRAAIATSPAPSQPSDPVAPQPVR